jgi:hypothetical protein
MSCEKDPEDDPNNNNNNRGGGSGYNLVKISGDNQTDTVNLQLSQALKVQVQDSLGAATQGVSVNFSVSSGGGSLSAATVTTDANGFAEVLWTLGAATGTQAVSATASVTVGSPLSFSATDLATSTASSSKNQVNQENLANLGSDNFAAILNCLNRDLWDFTCEVFDFIKIISHQNLV